MDAEHHRQQEQAGQHRRAKRVAVKMQEQPRHAGKQPAANRHDHRKGHRAHDQQRHRRSEDHIEVGRHYPPHLAFNPRPKDSGDQYADDIAARIDAVAEEGGNASVEAAGCLRVVAQHEQRGDNRAVHAGAAERLLRVIANQDTQEGEHPFAEDLHVANQRYQAGVRMGVLQHENLFRQGGEAQQQPDGDKAGDQRRKDSGEFGEKLLHRAGLPALQRLLFLRRDVGQRRRGGGCRLQQAVHHFGGGLRLAGAEHHLELLVADDHPHYAVNLADGGAVGQTFIAQGQAQARHAVARLRDVCGAAYVGEDPRYHLFRYFCHCPLPVCRCSGVAERLADIAVVFCQQRLRVFGA